jgi:hypothetical protein
MGSGSKCAVTLPSLRRREVAAPARELISRHGRRGKRYERPGCVEAAGRIQRDVASALHRDCHARSRRNARGDALVAIADEPLAVDLHELRDFDCRDIPAVEHLCEIGATHNAVAVQVQVRQHPDLLAVLAVVAAGRAPARPHAQLDSFAQVASQRDVVRVDRCLLDPGAAVATRLHPIDRRPGESGPAPGQLELLDGVDRVGFPLGLIRRGALHDLLGACGRRQDHDRECCQGAAPHER